MGERSRAELKKELKEKLIQLHELVSAGKAPLMGLDRKEWCGELKLLLEELLPELRSL